MKKSPSDADRHIGHRIRARRLELGMSQEKLGDLLGLTFQQVQKYEKGMNRVGAGRLLEIGKILQMPVANFFDGLSEGTTPAISDEKIVLQALATSEGRRLAKAFCRIENKQLRRRLVELVEAVSGPGSPSAGP